MEAVGLERARITDLEIIFIGPGRSTIEESQVLIVGFYIPRLDDGKASAFWRVMLPQGISHPVIIVAHWMHCEKNHIAEARLALGTSGPVPMRTRQDE